MPTSPDVISHWHHSVENLDTSAMDFYNSLEQALSLPVTRERIYWRESGI